MAGEAADQEKMPGVGVMRAAGFPNDFAPYWHDSFALLSDELLHSDHHNWCRGLALPLIRNAIIKAVLLHTRAFEYAGS